MGFLGVGLLSVGVFFCTNVIAESSSAILSLLAPAMFGITERKENNDYSELLKIDPHVTALIQEGKGFCTGTFLTPTTVLTARHCVNAKDPKGGVYIDGIASVNVFIEKTPEKDPIKSQYGDPYDLAILVFPSGTGNYLGIRSYPGIADGNPYVSNQTYMVGYGKSSFYSLLDPRMDDGFGIRGWGENEIEHQNDNLLVAKAIHYKADPKERKKLDYSNGLPGDSGGALYNSDGVILGVLSTMAIRQNADESLGLFSIFAAPESFDVANAFVDLTTKEAKDFIHSAIHCGDKTPCAENFAGSGTTANEKGSYQPFDGAPFSDVVLRGGMHKAKNDTRYVIPMYGGGQLMKILSRKVKHGKYDPIEELECIEDECENFLLPTERWAVADGRVSIAPLTKNSKDPLVYDVGIPTEYLRE